MKKDEVKGVTAKKKRKVVVPRPLAPENQHLSKDEFKAKRARENEANAAGEEARRKVMEGYNGKKAAPEADTSAADAKVASLRKQLANAEKNLTEKPTSAAWKKKVSALTDELEVAESVTE